jgi:hypothetical protein
MEIAMTQSKALSLAEHLECNDANMEAQNEAAAELRRLHALNAELVEALIRLMRSFPTDSDLHEARWDDVEIEEAMNAHEKAHAALAKAGETS